MVCVCVWYSACVHVLPAGLGPWGGGWSWKDEWGHLCVKEIITLAINVLLALPPSLPPLLVLPLILTHSLGASGHRVPVVRGYQKRKGFDSVPGGLPEQQNQSHKKKNSFSSSFILLSFSSSSSSINRLEFNTGWAVFDISSAILCRMRQSIAELEETIINFPSPVKANVTDIRDSLMSTMLTWHVQQTPGHASTCLHNFSHFSFFLQAK